MIDYLSTTNSRFNWNDQQLESETEKSKSILNSQQTSQQANQEEVDILEDSIVNAAAENSIL